MVGHRMNAVGVIGRACRCSMFDISSSMNT